MAHNLSIEEIYKSLARRTARRMCNSEFNDRVFATKMSGMSNTKELEKILDEHYKGAVIDVHYVHDLEYGGYLGKIAVIFETPEDHVAFRLTHGGKYL